jgi:hypothetical protein
MHFNFDDGGDIFLGNARCLLMDYTTLYYPENRSLHKHCCENLKCFLQILILKYCRLFLLGNATVISGF